MNQQPQMNMAGMAGGPVGGGPQMQPMNAGTPTDGIAIESATRIKLDTAIYDYLLRGEHWSVAREFRKHVNIEQRDAKQSPDQRQGMQPNGVDEDASFDISAYMNKPDDLPLPQTINDGPFLHDWWFQFWEIFRSHRLKGGKGATDRYINVQRGRANGMNGMNQIANPAMRNFNGMVGPNGMVMNNDLKRAAMQNNTRNMTPAQLAQMQKNMNAAGQNGQIMQGNQMERSGSNMDNRSGSPGSGDAPSPKRQRIDGGMQPMAQARPGQPGQMQQGTQQTAEVYAQSMQRLTQAAMNGINKPDSNGAKGIAPNMGPGGAQGSPMSQPGMDSANGEFYAATNGGARMPMQGNAAAAAAAGQGNNGNHALQDYQMQLMLLEQQNKKRLLMARQEQDSMSSHPGGVGPNGNFPPGSPSAGGQMIDPNNIPPQMRAQMMGANGQMMRPPSSHPNLNAQQMEMMRASGQMPMANGQFPPGQQPPQGMMPGQQPGQPGPQGTPRQANTNMPPPPAPAAGTQPSSPSQPAPPTPSTTNKAKPGNKKETAKKNAAKKNGAANATTTSEAEPPTPTPATPITPMNPKSFNHTAPGTAGNLANGGPNNAQPTQPPPGQAPPNAPPPDVQEPFGSLDMPDQFPMDLGFDMNSGDVLDNFDFDSFLNADGDGGMAFDANFAFGGDAIGSGIEGTN